MLTAKVYEALKSDVEYTRDKTVQYIKAKNMILEYLQTNDQITSAKIQEMCGFTKQQARSVIDKLGSDLELVKDSQGNEYTLTVDGGTPTPGKFAVTGNGYEVTVGELLKDKTAALVYKAKFKDGVLELSLIHI